MKKSRNYNKESKFVFSHFAIKFKNILYYNKYTFSFITLHNMKQFSFIFTAILIFRRNMIHWFYYTPFSTETSKGITKQENITTSLHHNISSRISSKSHHSLRKLIKLHPVSIVFPPKQCFITSIVQTLKNYKNKHELQSG